MSDYKFKTGDAVMHKTKGSPTMIVTLNTGDNPQSIRCRYINEQRTNIQDGIFHSFELKLSPSKQNHELMDTFNIGDIVYDRMDKGLEMVVIKAEKGIITCRFWHNEEKRFIDLVFNVHELI